MSLSDIIYKPLDSDASQIRLVTIEAGDWDSPISCTLTTTSINSHPQYEALSYVWGDDNHKKPILLNGCHFEATVNLESALRHVRKDRRRTMWIDALCINQKDIDERGSQVRLMQDIYGMAAETIIWLGDSTLQSKAAFALLGKFEVKTAISEHQPDGEGFRQDADKMKAFLQTTDSLKGLETIGNIAERMWFKRVWIIQELALARSALLKCGQDEIIWFRFAQIIRLLNAAVPFSLSPWDGFGDHHSRILNLHRIRLFAKFGRQLPITKLVAWNKKAVATDPRDMVFSLTGLTNASNVPLLRADYTLTAKQVYRNLFEYSVTMDKSLNIISLGQGALESMPEWPSWLPNWHYFSEDFGIPTPLLAELASSVSYGTDNPDSRNDSEITTFSASGSTKPSIFIDVEGSSLTAGGFVVDEVENTGGYSGGLDIRSNLDKWEKIVREKFGNCGDFSSVNEAIQNLLYFGTKERSGKQLPIISKAQKIARRIRYQVKPKLYPSGCTVIEAYGRMLCGNTDDYGRRLADFPFSTILKKDPTRTPLPSAAYYRQLVVSNGGYIGLAPQATATGDLICILLGCDMPVILRKQNGHHVFIGEAYMHGIMDGEAVHQLTRGLLHNEEFVLR